MGAVIFFSSYSYVELIDKNDDFDFFFSKS